MAAIKQTGLKNLASGARLRRIEEISEIQGLFFMRAFQLAEALFDPASPPVNHGDHPTYLAV